MERGKGLNKKKQSSAQRYLNLWPLDYDSYSQLLRYNGCHIWKIWEAKIIIHFYWQKLIKVSIRKICTVASFFKCNSFLCVWNNEILKECNILWDLQYLWQDGAYIMQTFYIGKQNNSDHIIDLCRHFSSLEPRGAARQSCLHPKLPKVNFLFSSAFSYQSDILRALSSIFEWSENRECQCLESNPGLPG